MDETQVNPAVTDDTQVDSETPVAAPEVIEGEVVEVPVEVSTEEATQ